MYTFLFNTFEMSMYLKDEGVSESYSKSEQLQAINIIGYLSYDKQHANHSSWISLIMTTSLFGSYYNYLYFTSEEIEAQKGCKLIQAFTAKFMQSNARLALTLRLVRKPFHENA